MAFASAGALVVALVVALAGALSGALAFGLAGALAFGLALAGKVVSVADGVAAPCVATPVLSVLFALRVTRPAISLLLLPLTDIIIEEWRHGPIHTRPHLGRPPEAQTGRADEWLVRVGSPHRVTSCQGCVRNPVCAVVLCDAKDNDTDRGPNRRVAMVVAATVPWLFPNHLRVIVRVVLPTGLSVK